MLRKFLVAVQEYIDVHPEFPRWVLIDDDNSKESDAPFLFCVSG